MSTFSVIHWLASTHTYVRNSLKSSNLWLLLIVKELKKVTPVIWHKSIILMIQILLKALRIHSCIFDIVHEALSSREWPISIKRFPVSEALSIYHRGGVDITRRFLIEPFTYSGTFKVRMHRMIFIPSWIHRLILLSMIRLLLLSMIWLPEVQL